MLRSWGPGGIDGGCLIGLKVDFSGHADDREDLGKLWIKATEFELAAVGRCAAPMCASHNANNPATQPLNRREIENKSMVPDIDQVQQILAQLLNVTLLHQ